MPAFELTIVIPLDLNRRTRELFKRVEQYIEAFQKYPDIQLIFGCNASPLRWVKKITTKIQNHSNIQLVKVEDTSCSLSRLRNKAIEQVITPYILFLDIDIWPDVELIKRILLEMQSDSCKLSMFPCLYLNQKGSKRIKHWTSQQYIDAYYDFQRDLILHLAFPSSIILTDTESVRAIQCFDEQYIGHGYEDFDFMLRLFHFKKLIDYTEDILIDTPYLAPLMSRGLRAVLAKPFLKVLFSSNYFLHEYHAKDKQEQYHQLREVNKQLFITKFAKHVEHPSQLTPLSLMNTFFDFPELKENNPKYNVLWAEIQGHKFRAKGLRKLL